MKRNTKVFVLLLIVAFIGNVGTLVAGSVYDVGFDKGYFDAINKISYFVSPCEGQIEEWVDGYKIGHKTGIKETLVEKTIIKKFEGFELSKSMKRVKDLYHAVSMNDDGSTHIYYMNTTRKLAEMVNSNFSEMNEMGEYENKDKYLNKYVETIGNIEIEERDAYIPANKIIVEYLRNGYRNAMENGTRFETRIFGEAIRKIEFLVGRGTVI